MEFEGRLVGFAIMIWLLMVGAFLYLPKIMGVATYTETIGWFQTSIILLILLPMSYFIVAWMDSR